MGIPRVVSLIYSDKGLLPKGPRLRYIPDFSQFPNPTHISFLMVKISYKTEVYKHLSCILVATT